MGVRVKVDTSKLDACRRGLGKVTYDKTKKVGESLAKTASGAAPRDTRKLENSPTVRTESLGGKGASTSVGFRAMRSYFDYAIFTHEANYKLGPGSRAKSGGIGMSGTIYKVGVKYLHRPLYGEQNEYAKFINTRLARYIQSFN